MVIFTLSPKRDFQEVDRWLVQHRFKLSKSVLILLIKNMVSVLNHKSAQLAEYGRIFSFSYGKNTDIQYALTTC